MPTPPPAASTGEIEFQAVEDYSSLLENRFIDLIEGRSGITFDQIKRRELKLDLLTRMEARRIPSFHAYLDTLLGDDPVRAEFKKLVNLITINETYFMRVDEHFTMLQEEVVPALRAQRPDRPLRILSAGCSSGEEVYSLVIALLEMGDRCPERFTVIGTDINEDMLYLAEKGIYRGRTLAKVPDCFLAKYFELYRDRYRVIPRVRDHAQFRYLNLTEPLPTDWLADLDIVFFRNVLIYFSRETTKRIIAGFHHLLREGGALFLGPSETLWDISNEFDLVMTPTAYMYRKKGLVALPAPLPRPIPPSLIPHPPQPPRPVPIPPPSPPPEEDKIAILREEAELMIDLGEYERAERMIGEILTMDRAHRPAILLRLTLLANQDRENEFAAYAATLTKACPIFPELYFLLGRHHESRHRPREALEQYRKVLFLTPSCLLAREKVMRILAQQGERDRARLEARNILAALAGKNWTDLLPQVGEKVQPDRLGKACLSLIED